MNTYSFIDVQAALVGPGGAVNLGDGSGASEEGISVAASDNINTMQVGADGYGQHSLHANKSGRVTVRLLKTSPTNQLLMNMYNFQTASPRTHGQNTISIRDSNRNDVITCEQCAFVKAPDLSFAVQAGMVEWDFESLRISRALGA